MSNKFLVRYQGHLFLTRPNSCWWTPNTGDCKPLSLEEAQSIVDKFNSEIGSGTLFSVGEIKQTGE